MTGFVRYWFYPLILAATLVFAVFAIRGGSDLQRAFAIFAGARFMLLLAVERAAPCRTEWSMTWRSFLRDLKYAAVVGGGLYLGKFLAGWLAIGMAERSTGALSHSSLVLQVVAIMLTYEFFQYWLHRISHEARGPVGRFLWRTHVQHHLPQRVYLLMHPVSHPINFAMVLAINALVIRVLGTGQDAVFLFNVLLGLQGLVSHFNVDIRTGPLNYLFIGTELHRVHHSAAPEDAGNYGVLTPFWDLIFGTFRYRPNQVPAGLGVYEPARYPTSNQLLATLLLPFKPKPPRIGEEP